MQHSLFQQNILLFLKAIILICCTFFAFTVSAASLSISPNTGVYSSGQSFTVRLTVNTSGAPINAADGTLSFNPKEISVVSVTKGSIFNLWTADPTFSNSAGTITFSGGSPTGYTGSAGTILSITFKAQNAGAPKISFSKGSVLAADGKGTNVLSAMNGGAYTISAIDTTPQPEKIIEYVAPANTPQAPTVISSTHADPTKWYTAKNAELSWRVGDDVIAVRTLLDTNASSIPTKVYDTPLTKLTLENLDEGVQYFHVQLKNADGWGKVTHFKLAIDSEKPTKFEPTLKEGSDLSNPIQTLSVKVEDATSNVRRFRIQVDGQEPYEYNDLKSSSTIQLEQLLPGHHTFIIEAFDEASNSIVGSLSFAILAFDKPSFTEYPQEINEQVIPLIKGITRPNSKVLVSITQLGIGSSQAFTTKTTEVQSDGTGVFVFIPDGKLQLGVYELTARAIDQYGAQSEPSDAIRIAVQQPGYLKIGSMVVSFLSVLIPLLALSAVLGVGVWLLLLKFKLFRAKVRKETNEVEAMLISEFGVLRSSLAEEKKALAYSRKTKKLTKAESDLFEHMDKLLIQSEKNVKKEVVDVEELVT